MLFRKYAIKKLNMQNSPSMQRDDAFLASDDFGHLLINFADSLDPDQDQHSVGPDLDSNPLTL